MVGIGAGLQLYQNHLLLMLFEKTVLFMSKSFCKAHFMTKSGNHYPMLTLHKAGLRVRNIRKNIVRSWNIVRGKKPKYRYMVYLAFNGIQLNISWREKFSY